jgi:hypothetical protein
MAGLDPAIHVFLAYGAKDVDARHKAGHDEATILLSFGLDQTPAISRAMTN